MKKNEKSIQEHMPSAEEVARELGKAVHKLLYLATMDITKKWSAPIRNWLLILNQLAIRFDERWHQ
ncbi:MAG: hypothetical protein U9R53_00550 [Chloroflexota bacterium]|nr:hypothetical protein [Chloroflexota bacterium]